MVGFDLTGILDSEADKERMAVLSYLFRRVEREIEGARETWETSLPAVISAQKGLNEPRYVSIRGIRKVSGMEIPVLDAGDLDLDGSRVGGAGSAVTVEEVFLPPRGEGAEMLEGSEEAVVEKLVERLQREGAF